MHLLLGMSRPSSIAVGLAAVCVGALLAGCLASRLSQRGRGHAVWLTGVCLLIGPILGLGFYGLAHLVDDVDPSDRIYYLKVFLGVGVGAGLLGAGLVAITATVAGRRG